MIRCKYKGKEPQNLAVGPVVKGSIIMLHEEEAFTLREDAQWELMPEAFPPGVPENLRPIRGKHFDLTSLPWKNKRLFNAVKTLGRSVLVKGLAQMEALGLPVPPISNTNDTADLRETFLELGRKAAWI